MKTGFTNKSKYSLVATAKRDGHHLLAVVLGAGNKDVRAEVATKMLNLGFAKYGTSDAVYVMPKQTYVETPTTTNPIAKYATDKKAQPAVKPVVSNGGTGVQCGAFSVYESAKNQAKRVQNATGLNADVQQNESGLYRVRINGLSESSAQSIKNKAASNGIDCYVFH